MSESMYDILFADVNNLEECIQFIEDYSYFIDEYMGHFSTMDSRAVRSLKDHRGRTSECLRMVYEHEVHNGNVDFSLDYYSNFKEYRYPFYYASVITAVNDIKHKLRDKLNEDECRRFYKFDESLIPKNYSKYNSKEVNEANFSGLLKELRTIADKYVGLTLYKNGDYGLSRWNAECLYEQAKFMEEVEWVGKEIDAVTIESNPQYISMTEEQLMFYLWWRTQFFKGNFYYVDNGYLSLLKYEIVMQIGKYSNEERVMFLETLAEKYMSIDYKVFSEIQDLLIMYERAFHLIDKNKVFMRDPAKWGIEWDICCEEVMAENYTHAAELIVYQSAYKFRKHTLAKMIPCEKYIVECLNECVPYLVKFYAERGLCFGKTLAYKKTEAAKDYFSSDYDGDHFVERRVLKNAYSYGGMYWLKDNRLAVSDGIIVIIENAFRRFFQFGQGLKVKNPYASEYICQYCELEVDEYRKYKGCFKDVCNLLINLIDDYLNIHKDELIQIKNDYLKSIENSQEPVVKEKKHLEEQMIDYLVDGECINKSFDDFWELYSRASITEKKRKARKIKEWIWSYWILHDTENDYKRLCKMFGEEVHNIFSIRAIENDDFVSALPYVLKFHNSCDGSIAKKVKPNLIADCIIITLNCLSEIFNEYNLKFADIILGEVDEFYWEPFENDDEPLKVYSDNIIKNINGVEIYTFCDGKGVVERHSYSPEAFNFLAYLLRRIDNYLRDIYKIAKIKDEFDFNTIEELASIDGLEDKINTVIIQVVSFCLQYNTPKYVFPKTNNITDFYNTQDKSLNIKEKNQCKKECLEVLVDRGIKDYYQINGEETLVPYDIIEVDVDNNDMSIWQKKGPKRTNFRYENKPINRTSFFADCDKKASLLLEVRNQYNVVKYNPNYDFRDKNIMKNNPRINTGDSIVIETIMNDGDDFYQWIRWTEQGKVIFPKNEAYVKLLFYFIINRWIFKNDANISLIVMCQFWNYYFRDPKQRESEANSYLRWIKDFCTIYCKDVSYDMLTSLLRCNIDGLDNKEYESRLGDSGKRRNKARQFRDLLGPRVSTAQSSFYSSYIHEEYDYSYGRSIQVVYEKLKKLWEEYGLDFDYHLIKHAAGLNGSEYIIFARAILVHSTRKDVYARLLERNDLDGDIKCEENGWPLISYESQVSANAADKMLLEYIKSAILRALKYWENIKYGDVLDREKLYDVFQNKLFLDNKRGAIIEKVVTKAVLDSCKESGDTSLNPKIRDHVFGSDSEIIMDIIDSDGESNIIGIEQTISTTTIKEARELLIKNQNRLVLDEEDEINDKEVMENCEKENSFSDNERTFIRALLYDDIPDEKLSSLSARGISLSLLAESINNKAIDIIGDTVVDTEDGFALVDDYIDELEEIIS